MESTKKDKVLFGISVAALIILIIVASFILREPEPGDAVNVQPVADITDTAFVDAEADSLCNPIMEHYIELIDANYETLMAMEEAFARQESENNPFAYSKRDHAVGLLQVTPIMLKHFHEIVDSETFSDINDMYEESYCRTVFEVVQLHDNPKLDIDRACDVWNPGCPRVYRQNVKRVFNKLK